MADDFGLKIGIEGEREFRAALKDINQQFKVLGSEMKLVESQFDKQDRGVSALTARNGVLTRQISEQKDKIELLRKALENSAESFGENDRRTQQWTVQLNNAEAELNNMERELKNNEKAIDGVGDEFQTAEKKADGFGDEVEDTADQAERARARFEKLGSVLKSVGIAMGTVLVAAGAAVYKLGKAVVEQFGQLEQNLGGSEAVFGEYAASMQKTGEDAYRNLGVSQSEYLATANKMGALFQGVGVDQQTSLALTEKAMQRAADMASVMGIETSAALEAVTGAAKGNFTMMDNLGVAMNATSIQAYAVAKGLDFAWSSATQAQKAEIAMQMFFENTEQYAGNFARESSQTITGSIGMLKAAAQSWVAGLGNAEADTRALTRNMIDAFKTVMTNITPVLENIVKALPEALGAVFSEMSTLLPTILTTVTSIFKQLLGMLIKLLPELIPVAVDAVMTIIWALVDNLPLLVSTAAQLILALVNGIGKALPELIPAIVQAVVLIVASLLGNIDQVIEAGMSILLGLIEGIINALPVLIEAMPQLITAIVTCLIENLPQILSAGVRVIMALIQGIVGSIPQLSSNMPRVVSSIVNGVSKAIASVVNIGKNIVQGLWQGIQSMGQWIQDKIGSLFRSVINGAKSVLGIHSPSTVFAGIGENMGLGLGVGFTDAMRSVEEEMKRAIPTKFDGLNIDVGAVVKSPVSTNTSGSTTQAGNVENKYEIVINNPRPEPASGSIRTTLLKHSYGLA